MRLTPTFRTVAAGCIALGALLMAQAVSPDSAQASAQVRSESTSAATASAGDLSQLIPGVMHSADVTWGS
ncbi:hypothetical protein DEJ48_02665 [Streptomyces venezuelae]|uniref:Uncharacterized protein n=1 Tax=Streptomyces venezuelae TaxID=54571 RepID=A0A5P2BR55_STRVZ|nr:hypothetical protein [Streptomyces venezuelae]QES32450.1 hypothetical protein DEJ48_02665 [Streptomyces venezuelae]